MRGLSLLDKNYQTNTILKFFYYYLFKFLLLFIDVKVFVSHHNLEYARKINLVKNGEVIYNGLKKSDLYFLPGDKSRKFFSQAARINLADKIIIGSIGRLTYAKNYEFLINIFPKILQIDAKLFCFYEKNQKNNRHVYSAYKSSRFMFSFEV